MVSRGDLNLQSPLRLPEVTVLGARGMLRALTPAPGPAAAGGNWEPHTRWTQAANKEPQTPLPEPRPAGPE